MPISDLSVMLGNVHVYWGTAAPAAAIDGYFGVGDIVFNSVPTSGQPVGWVCSVAGKPGTWLAMGNFA